MKIHILSIPRSGSAYVRSLLNFYLQSDTDYFSVSEPFNKDKLYPLGILFENIKKNKTVVIKNQISHIIDLDVKVLEQFKQVNWITICLLRKNLFDATISRCISHKTGIWDADDGIISESINLDPDFFIYNFKLTINYTELLLNDAYDFKYKNIIYYEDLTFDNSADLKLIGLPQIGISNKISTIPNKEKSLIVKNYFDLKQHALEFVKKTRFQIINTESLEINETN